MDQYRTWIIDELVEIMNISHGTVQSLLVKHEYRKVGPTWLPHELSCYDKERRVRICRDNLRLYNRDNEILNRIIALDVSWVRCYETLDPQQAKEWRKKDEKRFNLYIY